MSATPDPNSRLAPDEELAASRARSFFARAWRIYDFFFFRLLDYGPAVRAFLAMSVHLRSGDRVLDAGCGTGLLTRALYTSVRIEGIDAVTFHAFDLTPQMIGALDAWIDNEAATGIETAIFNVLDLEARPAGWDGYDRIVTSSMMEYLPRSSLAAALRGLGTLLKTDGSLLLVITRRNRLTNLVVGKLWRSNLYTRQELAREIEQAGFQSVAFKDFPGKYQRFGRSVILVEMSRE